MFWILFTYHWRIMYLMFDEEGASRTLILWLPVRILVMTFISIYMLLGLMFVLNWIVYQVKDWSVFKWPLELKYILGIYIVLLYPILAFYTTRVFPRLQSRRSVMLYPKNGSFTILLVSLTVVLVTYAVLVLMV